MLRVMRRLRWLAPWLFLALLQGCGAAGERRVEAPPSSKAAVTPELVQSERFGELLARALGDHRTDLPAQRRWAGLVRRQLENAERWLELGQRRAALAAVRGALLLVKSDMASRAMWQGRGKVLLFAAEETARVGDEGATRGAYELVLESEPDASVVVEIREHLRNIAEFAASAPKVGPVETLGKRQRVAVRHALFRPSIETRGQALTDTRRWIDAALSVDLVGRVPESSEEREEAVAAYRARQFGMATLVGLYLRDGDPVGALRALEASSASDVVPEPLLDRLKQVAIEDRPSAWLELFRLYQSAGRTHQPEVTIDEELARAAAFGAAIELLQSAPGSLAGAGAMAILLTEYAMPQAVVPLLEKPLLASSEPGDVAWALGIVNRAVLAASQLGEFETSRSIAKDVEPLLDKLSARGEQKELSGAMARVMDSLAETEQRGGDLDRARRATLRSLALQPTAEGYLALARVERQRQALDAARDALLRCDEANRTTRNLTVEIERRILGYEIEEARADLPRAEAELGDALRAALAARRSLPPGAERARSERLLGRILELFGDDQGAERAYGRSLIDAGGDAREAGATLLELSRSALSRRLLGRGRRALEEIVSVRMEPDVQLYAALWLHLLERAEGVVSDGTVEEAVSRLDGLSSWNEALRRWLLGQLPLPELERLAQTPLEKIEAKFYLALGAPTAPSSELLAAVRDSSGVDLIEVTMARDALRKSPPPRRPPDVTVP